LPDAGLLAEFLYNVMRAGFENLLAVPEGDTPNFCTLSKKTSALQRQICTQTACVETWAELPKN